MSKNLDLGNKINKYIYREKVLGRFARAKELAINFAKALPMSLRSCNSSKYLQGVKLADWYTPSIPDSYSEDLKITWIGHSSFLIQISGINILVDPIFYGLMFLYKRVLPSGINIKDLPKIDYVLISHDHADHFDYKTLLELKKFNPTILIPEGTSSWFFKNNFLKVIELDWWQDCFFYFNNKEIKFSFLPAVHWSGRKYSQINKSFWGSWMITVNYKNIYFAGDTAYDNHFKDIAQYFKTIDIALMPIGPVEPRDTVKFSHLCSKQAVKAFIDLNAENFIPMHWGTFKLNLDTFSLPIQRLHDSWEENKEFLSNKKLHVLKFGECVKL